MKKLFLLLCLSALFTAPAFAQPTDKGTKVKAVFLYKFLDYITWPGVPPGTEKTAHVCVYGENIFGDVLPYIQAKWTPRKKTKLRYITGKQSAVSCHILFTHSGHIPDKVGKETLIVSDQSGFTNKSRGMIELQETRERIKLRINLKTLTKQGFKVSSKLLKIADVLR